MRFLLNVVHLSWKEVIHSFNQAGHRHQLPDSVWGSELLWLATSTMGQDVAKLVHIHKYPHPHPDFFFRFKHDPLNVFL